MVICYGSPRKLVQILNKKVSQSKIGEDVSGAGSGM